MKAFIALSDIIVLITTECLHLKMHARLHKELILSLQCLYLISHTYLNM